MVAGRRSQITHPAEGVRGCHVGLAERPQQPKARRHRLKERCLLEHSIRHQVRSLNTFNFIHANAIQANNGLKTRRKKLHGFTDMTETVPHGQAVLIFVMVCRQAQIIWLAEYSLISHTTVTNERSIRGAMILFFWNCQFMQIFKRDLGANNRARPTVPEHSRSLTLIPDRKHNTSNRANGFHISIYQFVEMLLPLCPIDGRGCTITASSLLPFHSISSALYLWERREAFILI